MLQNVLGETFGGALQFLVLTGQDDKMMQWLRCWLKKNYSFDNSAKFILYPYPEKEAAFSELCIVY